MNIGDTVVITNPKTTLFRVGTIGTIVDVNRNLYTVSFENKVQVLYDYEMELVNKKQSIDNKITAMYNRQKYVHNLRH